MISQGTASPGTGQQTSLPADHQWMAAEIASPKSFFFFFFFLFMGMADAAM